MRSSDMLGELAADLAAANADLTDIVRSSTANAGTYSYTYADLGAIMGAVRPILQARGISVLQSTAEGNGIVTRLLHMSGQWIESEPCVIPAKGGAQDIGSAITYARRYSLLAMLGLATEDDDGARAQQAHEDDKPHPLSDRVGAVQAELRRLTDTEREALRSWADGRKLSGASMLADEKWLELVEAWLDEWKATTDA